MLEVDNKKKRGKSFEGGHYAYTKIYLPEYSIGVCTRCNLYGELGAGLCVRCWDKSVFLRHTKGPRSPSFYEECLAE